MNTDSDAVRSIGVPKLKARRILAQPPLRLACIFVGVMLIALIVTIGDLVFKAVRKMKALRRQSSKSFKRQTKRV